MAGPRRNGGLAGSLGAAGDSTLSLAGAAINFLDVALATHMVGRLEANRQELSDQTEARLQQLEKAGRLDEQVLQDPHFHAVVFQATIAAAQESESEKIDWYAAILAGAASRERPEELNVRALLSSMTFLTAAELRLSREFYENPNRDGWGVIDGVAGPLWGPDTGLYLKRLEAANLLSPRSITGGGPGGPTSRYFVTDTFQRLMTLVTQTDATERSTGMNSDPAG